ncbi:hypothetical protein F3Y22_tig00112206pilonHSYRG00074 [Hibiscus syriacus]|uniref:Salicylate carboxymethyltransferase n=1 Tax=Hibiscus syriacus TaxID=106335 RepID=A0A6A2X4M1_HIBSY|nr:hypothetical protein F3Y22_tig00112206pilonHSYRG00074 [Hibiscus syriacus]
MDTLSSMEIEQVLHMNGGDGKTSYSNNSSIQKRGMYEAKPMLEDSIKMLFCDNSFPCCLKIVTSGFTARLMEEKGSDFGPCFIAAVPGTFYGRLFPNNFLHFVHSSYSLHWRSQVPETLVSESGAALNKGNICMAKTSPHTVHKAYFDVFKRDFKLFLKLRFEEMVPGGHMVLTMVGSKIRTSSSKTCTVWELMGMALYDMVLEGLIEEAKLDGFNLPYYAPTPEEVKHVIRRKNVARNIRAIAEPLLENHFTNANMDDLFERFADKIADYLEKERGQCTTIAVSMIKA